VLVDVAQHVEAHLLALRLDVHHLAADEALRAARAAELHDHAQHALGRHAARRARDVLKRVRQHRVAREDGHVLAVHLG
jgi:hypothetical protein